jgi:hypothetical protein
MELRLQGDWLQGEMTYGTIGEWRFDKRSYTQGAPPKNLPLPPPGVPQTVVRWIALYKCKYFKLLGHLIDIAVSTVLSF